MSAELTDTQDELYLELTGTVCRCQNEKVSGQTFCKACYFRLPGQLAVKLYRRMGAGYEGAYAEAATWLDAHPAGEVKGHAAEPEAPAARPHMTFDVPIGKLATCRGCGARVYWIVTKNQKNMPVNPDRTSHWATCTHAKQFRSKKK